MTKEDKIKMLKFRANTAKWACLGSFVLLAIINSPHIVLMNWILWTICVLSAFYSLYDFHLFLNTDAYKEDVKDIEEQTSETNK